MELDVKESDRCVMLSVMAKWKSLRKTTSTASVYSSAQIRTKHPLNTSQKRYCLKRLARCDVCFVFTTQGTWRREKIL